MALDRVLVVPRWSGRPTDDWYPALQAAVQAAFREDAPEVRVLDMPEPDLPTLEAWGATLRDAAGPDPGRTLLVGHSVGCQAVIRYLAALPPGHQAAGVVLVAAWLDVDEPWESLRPWTETPIDVARVRAATPTFEVLLSPTDRFTSDVAANRARWAEGFGADARVVPGEDHFNGRGEPAVVGAILARMARLRQP